MTARLDALRARLDERLLVTNLVNIEYLTGFASLERGAARRAGAGEALHRLPLHPRRRAGARRRGRAREALADARPRRAARRPHRVRGRRAAARRRSGARLGRARARADDGIVEACARSRTRARSTKIRRATRAADHAFHALTAETWVGHTERELAWRLRTLMHAHGVDHLSFDTAILSGANGAKPHAEPGDRSSSRRRSSSPTGARGSTATAPTARARSRPGRCPPSSGAPTTSASRRSSPRSRGSARA